MGATIRVGAAMANVTPSRELPNYNGTPCRPGENDSDLRCHALVLADAQGEAAIVAVDATFIGRPLLLTIRDECERRAAIPGERLFVAANHTHACPATCPSFLSSALPDPIYLDFLVEQVVQAVRAAQARARPVRLVAGTAPSPGIELNRRSLRPDGGIAFQRWDPGWPLEGPMDTAVGFLAFESDDGDPLAIVASYACHNNCCGTAGGTYHRDLFGRAGDALRTIFPSLQATPFLAGPCGNIIFGDPGVRRHLSGDAFAREGGRRCAELIATAYRAAPRAAVPRLEFTSRVLELPDRPLSESTFCDDGCRGTTEAALAFARRRYDPEQRAVAERGATTCPVEVAALVLGDAALVTNPAELFVEFGLDLKQRSPFATTLVAELTNGYCGYVPTEAAFAHGGYETHRTVYTSRLAKDGGERIVEASLDLLGTLRSHAGASAPAS